MKKWLNIKPKVHDFSEDEVDTETESEDDDAPSKGYRLGHRRGKSETLRAQYINTKDVRVTISTWNVAGRLPSDDLEIDDWLCTKEPADVYIIGWVFSFPVGCFSLDFFSNVSSRFQEVVPLNAGNVFGAEDSRPIPKWEAIIRRTLNKYWEPETKHKCYSAPPSPVLRTSSVADALADKIDALPSEVMINEYLETAIGYDFEGKDLNKDATIGQNLQLNRIYGIDFDSRLDWPEYPLDATPQVISSNLKLRRVLSSSARIGFNMTENSMFYSSHDVVLKESILKRSHHSFGNLRSTCVHEQQELETVDSSSDISDEKSEEEDDAFLEGPMEEQDNNKARSTPKYIRIVSKQMVGIYISIWVRKRLRRHVNNLKVSPVGVGLMGYMGNKGSVSVSMTLFQSRLCFVCSHLTSGQKDGAEHRRNSDVYEIIRRTCFSSVLDSDQPQTIPAHDQIFWFGDLNYRLNMSDADIRELVAQKRWNELINYDQLHKELRSGHVFEGWKEGIIDFPPTYKYEMDSDRYIGEIPKEGEKKRSPAWCDRILWSGKGIKQLSYKQSDIRLSDHRPVSSMFLLDVEVLDHRKLQRALNVSTAAVHPVVSFDENGEPEF
ncbi:hypothetical protein Goklo_014453 [Gossypium klotzschianum]|uniref:Inositol polyphosphate-related phosphatase domain-containing protein n=1 Tax=Gossypium klotzschianum TaxID=34286 RepID=A0A7J8U840_9ROSI|nr:hypothetical protein [Gossypium klotzschianum]